MRSKKKIIFQFMKDSDDEFHEVLGLELFWLVDGLIDSSVVSNFTYAQTFESSLENISNIQWREAG
jgi:hypothetical protein